MLGSFRIAGTGSALPEAIMTNDDLAKIVDTNDEWIVSRTGIHERHIARDESTLDLAETAARAALDAAGMEPADIGAVIVATMTPDRVCPSCACELAGRLGGGAYGFDLNAACSGFVYALHVARGLLALDDKPVLVVGADRMSSVLDWTDRSTCVLFGDGAGAAVVVPEESDRLAMTHVRMFPDVKGALTVEDHDDGRGSVLEMDGKAVYKFASREMPDILVDLAEEAGLSLDALDWIVPHQANARIIATAAERLKLAPERVFMNIAHTGNTSAASVPIALDELARSGELSRGDRIALVAFGGGLTSAAAILEW